MKRYLTKHTATLLFSIILLAQAAMASAGGTAITPLDQEPTRELDSGRVVKQSTDEPYPTEIGTEDPTPTEEITVEVTPTMVSTLESTPTDLPTEEATATITPSNESTPTDLPTEAPSATYTETSTAIFTEIATVISTQTASYTPTFTETIPSLFTETPTYTPTFTATATLTQTASPTATSTPLLPTLEPTATSSFTATSSPTLTATVTSTASATTTPVPPTLQPTATPSHTSTPTLTLTPLPPTATPTRTSTPLPPTATPFAPDCTYSIAPGDVYGAQGLIWAIRQANASANPDIICLASGSTYSVIQVYENNTGLPLIRTPITLRGYNAALNRPTTRGAADFRLLYVEAGADFRLDAVSIVGGQAVQGGGIYSAGTLTITNTIIDGNNALAYSGQSSGGGIYIADGNVNITDTMIRNNRANTGAGIYALGSNTRMITINRVIFSANQASLTGGGVFNFNANVAIFSSQFISNTASQGAGIRNQVFGILSMSNSLVRGNTATTSGGGIATDNANVTANNNCILANTAPSGSAVYSSVTSGTKANFEFNWWGSTGQPASGDIVGAVDFDPALITAPQFCKSLFAR